MRAAESASFDIVHETIRSNHYETAICFTYCSIAVGNTSHFVGDRLFAFGERLLQPGGAGPERAVSL
jgi:hypothetical protein